MGETFGCGLGVEASFFNGKSCETTSLRTNRPLKGFRVRAPYRDS